MEEFELDVSMERFLTISKRLDNARVPFFSNTVTLSQMEIPAEFVRNYGEELFPKAMVRLASGSRVWQLKIQLAYSTRWRVRFCNRWRRFISDNGLRRGDELIVSLVATSEFVIYMFKKHLEQPPKLYRSPSLTTDTSSQASDSSGDDLPENDEHNPKSRRSTELRARQPLNVSTPRTPSTPALKVMQWGNISPDNFLARRLVARDQPESSRDSFKRQKVAASSPRREPVREKRPEISENIFNGESRFRKKLKDSCIGHYGNPRFARFEIPAYFLRGHQRFFNEGTVFTLEGPTLDKTCQVACHRVRVTNHRVMWTGGWPRFVKRNKLKKGDELEFTLVTPDRFSVELMGRKRYSARDHTMPFKDAIFSRERRGSPARRGKTSDELPSESVNRTHRSEDADLHTEHHFIKTLPPSSDVECNPYPFLSHHHVPEYTVHSSLFGRYCPRCSWAVQVEDSVQSVPASFWHKVKLPLEVNMQGPNSDEVFAVKCSGVGKTSPSKSFALGWREFAYTNMLQAGDTLQFTYAIESKLFTVEYASEQ